jgi:hypothetical protein
MIVTRDEPDTNYRYAGYRYSAKLKAGYRISGRISDAGRIPDIRPDFQLSIQISSKI